jgi:hypothetical protein
MRAIGYIGIGATLGLLSIACSGAGPSSAGTAGGGGAAGGGGGSAGVAAALELPGCLRDLLAQCAPEGPCVSTTAPAGFGSFCFDSRVSASAIPASDSRACGGSIQTMQVNKPDGTPCYTYATYADASSTDCELRRYTWTDAAGNVVATGMSSPSPSWDLSITCGHTFETSRCAGPRPDRYPPDGCCYLSMFGAAVCQAGVPVGVACANGDCP